MSGRRDLALLGGDPVVPNAPSVRWPPVTEDDARLVADMALAGELSYYGRREGHVRELEDKFNAYLGTRYALATSSGTAALHSAYFGLGLEPGSEVLAPTYTFLATVMPLFVVNAVPVLVDADPTTGNIDPGDLERHVTDRTRAIVVTHLWGNPVDMPAIMEIARRRGLMVVEDCSHAHGATCDGRASWHVRGRRRLQPAGQEAGGGRPGRHPGHRQPGALRARRAAGTLQRAGIRGRPQRDLRPVRVHGLRPELPDARPGRRDRQPADGPAGGIRGRAAAQPRASLGAAGPRARHRASWPEPPGQPAGVLQLQADVPRRGPRRAPDRRVRGGAAGGGRAGRAGIRCRRCTPRRSSRTSGRR